jgi:hypothetical protein
MGSQNDVLYFPISFSFSPLPEKILKRKSKRPVGSFGKFDVKPSTGQRFCDSWFYETTVTVATM